VDITAQFGGVDDRADRVRDLIEVHTQRQQNCTVKEIGVFHREPFDIEEARVRRKRI
jgi:hypothetical protein